ncbi:MULTISPECIES: hypothetical protein [Legionella]|uniref:Uncharacterized protein n=1 Tax=Legionella resiliens TaxID=2905958 RepID=A0ABS8X4W1_9GAMM|nr:MULTISPECIES: hypothetical protein [unclassified Legionella]MCE0723847.1 hypothetical protein [Legionella sp. 9fVS26]MCE3532999.1 hypothetical protein [Legionella sp. 8cVS16]QLZ69190.1 hypothetical protein FOLKNPGA_01972 [Legionella sp. PC1000]
MQSKSENRSVIFSSEVSASVACSKLEKKGAADKPDKYVWLLRESSVPGLLTITSYNNEKNNYVHQRIGFVGGKWEFGPKDFLKAQEFAKRAEASFSQAIPENSFDSLVKLLTDNGFNIGRQLLPKSNESTQNKVLLSYTEDVFEESANPNSAKRYTDYDQ